MFGHFVQNLSLLNYCKEKIFTLQRSKSYAVQLKEQNLTSNRLSKRCLKKLGDSKWVASPARRHLRDGAQRELPVLQQQDLPRR